MSDAAEKESPGPLTCAKCGCSSTLRSQFVRGRDGTVARTWCPPCAARRRDRLASFGLGCCVLALPLAWALSARHPHDPVLAFVVGLYAYYLSSYFMTYLHEFGHALAARLVGFSTLAIKVGTGPTLLDRYVLGVRLQFGLTPGGGATLLELRDVEGFRWRMVAVLAAGSLVNLGAAIVALSRVTGGEESSPVRAALVGFAVGNLVHAVASVWPRRVRTPHGLIASDGAQILARLAGEPVDLRAHAAFVQWYRANFAYADCDHGGALRALAQMVSLTDDTNMGVLAATLRAEALSESGEARAAIDSLAAWRSRTGLPQEARLALDSAYAWAAFLCDEPLLARDGLQYVKSWASLMPWSEVLRIKNICLLSAFPTDCTAVQEARRLADSLRELRLEGESRAYAALARGMVAAAERNRDLASAELANARRLRASPAALAVLERRLQDGAVQDGAGACIPA